MKMKPHEVKRPKAFDRMREEEEEQEAKMAGNMILLGTITKIRVCS
jgi:hypothetical protein